MGRKIYGRAFRISKEEASKYERASRPRRYTPNPLGVTAMALVNGRGSYRSAREVSQGKTREERIERARQLIRNGEKDMSKRAGFLKNRRRRTFRRNEAAHEGWEEVAAGRDPRDASTIERSQKALAQKRRKASAKKTTAKKAASKKAASKKAAPKKLTAAQKKAGNVRRGKRLAAYSAAKRSGKSEAAAKRAALRVAPLQVGETFKGSKKRKASKKKVTNRVVGAPPKKAAARKYERLYMIDPRTGKRRLSFMAKGKRGKRVKIPAKVLVKTGYMSQDKIDAARKKAAARILKSGDAFVPNRRKGKKMATARQKRAGRRLVAYRKAQAEGKGKRAAAEAAIRAVPLLAGDTFKGMTSATPKKRKKAGTKKRTTKKGKAAKRAAKTGKGRSKARKAKTTRRKVSKKTTVRKTSKKAPSRSRKSTKRKTAKKSTKRSSAKKSSKKSTKRKSKSRKMRKNGYAGEPTRKHGSRVRRRKMRRNSFLSSLKQVVITGLFVGAGFATHKVLTNVLTSQVVDKFAAKLPAFVQTWKRPIVGLAVLGVGIPLTQKLVKKNSTEIAAGMVASWLQTTLVTALSKKPEYAGYLSGYSNSRAYALRGSVERDATSIMPRYAPLSAYSQAAAGFQQAAAGFQQAAAGTGEYFAGTGEYFAPNATGEYFAPNNLQGVGSYEGAGSLALQAAAGASEIDDGIRPDSDIDGILDLAEAAAGLRGTGEFYSAIKESGGRVVEQRVGTSSQWIPAGPLWAGADRVDDTQDTSELSAGILMRQGGNGVLSAG